MGENGFYKSMRASESTNKSSTHDMACSAPCKRMCADLVSFVRAKRRRFAEFEAELAEFEEELSTILDQQDKEHTEDKAQHQDDEDETASPILTLGLLDKFKQNPKEAENCDCDCETENEEEAPENMWCTVHETYCASGQCKYK